MIIIINGPLGIGKTETSWELLYRLERGVMLDGDYLGAVQPFEIYDPEREEYLYATLRHMVAYHQDQGGYQDFVINYVFETPQALARLRCLLLDLDGEIYAFRLTCSKAEIARRIQARSREPQRVTWELQRSRELVAIQDAAALRGDLGFAIDTTSLTAAETAAAIWDNLQEAVQLMPYDPTWEAQFEAEKARVAAALGERVVEIHHIGSTAVPGLCAKPVIDLLVVVPRLEDAEACMEPLQALGYIFIDHPQNTDRRFFRKGRPRTHHLHIVARGSPAHLEHLAFRDILRADPQAREAYAQLKLDLAERYRHERAKYTDAKTEFVRAALDAWSRDEGSKKPETNG